MRRILREDYVRNFIAGFGFAAMAFLAIRPVLL